MVNETKDRKITQRIFLLDTNVLVYDPKAIFAFKNGLVGIPSYVLDEIDSFKRESSDRGRNAREVNHLLDSLRSRGSLRDGVDLDNGGRLQVFFLDETEKSYLSIPFKADTLDNLILLLAVALKGRGLDVRFISKDINARVKADILGINTEDYFESQVTKDKFYKGWVRIGVPAVQLKSEFPADLKLLVDQVELTRNEFVLVEAQSNPHHYRVFRYIGGKKFIPVNHPTLRWPLAARNPQQLMALNLLFDPSIQLVSLLGSAGTGKTFLALLAGLHKVLIEHEYKKMLVSRPVVPLGRDIGYLPGTVDEKLLSWMQPVYDNIEFIMHNVATEEHLAALKRGEINERHSKGDRDKNGRQNKKDKDHKEKGHMGGLGTVDQLVKRGKLSLEAITYMRGRSIPYQYILIDEVQNLTPHEVKTIVSRVGEGSKIVLAGDPYQIDSPYLDFSSNGLVVTSEKFKGQSLYGSVFLEHSERSELSELAGKLL